MHIFNSSSKSKEKFISIKEGEVSIYSCGSTVYDYSHLGHARNAIVFDLLYRILKQKGFEVLFARNYTDIDDKIINKANEQNISIQDLSEFYINADIEVMKTLNILPATYMPKATKYINNMIDFIDKLLRQDVAYITSDGVYFDVSKDDKYGSISHRLQDDAISTIEENQEKRNIRDFALWKFEEKEDISYDAPFGRGRPGWHTECSVMIDNLFSNSSEYLIDIHCGGSDLLFPHHENEATQIRCLNNQEISKYWMHNGFVQIDNEKMSKSLGNSFYIKDILSSYDSEVLRVYLMSVHYRANFNFSHDGLDEAKKILDKLYRLKKIVYEIDVSDDDFIDEENLRVKIIESLEDDINISKAMSYINKFISNSNEFLTSIKDKKAIKEKKKNIAKFFIFLNKYLGILGKNPYDYFRFGLSKDEIKSIDELIKQRNIYRKEKNYIEADKIKEILIKQNIQITDTCNGTQWEKI